MYTSYIHLVIYHFKPTSKIQHTIFLYFRPRTFYQTVQEGQHLLTGQRAANFMLLANQWAQASDAMTSRLPRYEAKCVQRRCLQCGPVPLRSDIKGTELRPANILIPLERQLIAPQLCRRQFLYNETLQQAFHPVLSKSSKRRQI